MCIQQKSKYQEDAYFQHLVWHARSLEAATLSKQQVEIRKIENKQLHQRIKIQDKIWVPNGRDRQAETENDSSQEQIPLLELALW